MYIAAQGHDNSTWSEHISRAQKHKSVYAPNETYQPFLIVSLWHHTEATFEQLLQNTMAIAGTRQHAASTHPFCSHRQSWK